MIGLIDIPTTPREQNRRCRPRADQRAAGFSPAGHRINVVQRYVYSPYGSLTILSADFNTPPQLPAA